MPRPRLNKPTKRIYVTLDQDYIDLLDEFAALNDIPRGTSIRKLLEALKPSVQSIIDIAETAKNDEKKALRMAHEHIGSAFFEAAQKNLFND